MLKQPSKKIRRREGQVLKVPLSAERWACALVLKEPLVAFYDKEFSGGDDLTLKQIIDLPVAFSIMVMNHAITSGRWSVLGSIEVPGNLEIPPAFCKQDAGNGSLSIYQEVPELAPHYERPAAVEECRGLERAAVWNPEHVEDRLRDHFAGVPNRWVESLKLKT